MPPLLLITIALTTVELFDKLNMLDENRKFKNDKELIKHCKEVTQEMYKTDLKNGFGYKYEDCEKNTNV